jgi:hypothetical protein
MSTTFGIPKSQVNIDRLLDENGELHEYIDTSFFENVFFRGRNDRWLSPFGEMLPRDMRVFPLDNSAQGIYTIGDIKDYLKSKVNPIYKLNNSNGAMLCNKCRSVISTGEKTNELYCEKCKDDKIIKIYYEQMEKEVDKDQNNVNK